MWSSWEYCDFSAPTVLIFATSINLSSKKHSLWPNLTPGLERTVMWSHGIQFMPALSACFLQYTNRRENLEQLRTSFPQPRVVHSIEISVSAVFIMTTTQQGKCSCPLKQGYKKQFVSCIGNCVWKRRATREKCVERKKVIYCFFFMLLKL